MSKLFIKWLPLQEKQSFVSSSTVQTSIKNELRGKQTKQTKPKRASTFAPVLHAAPNVHHLAPWEPLAKVRTRREVIAMALAGQTGS